MNSPVEIEADYVMEGLTVFNKAGRKHIDWATDGEKVSIWISTMDDEDRATTMEKIDLNQSQYEIVMHCLKDMGSHWESTK